MKILPGLLLSLGSTEEEARRRSDELHDAGPAAYSVQWLSQAIGYDATKLELDEPFPEDVLAAPADPQTSRSNRSPRPSSWLRPAPTSDASYCAPVDRAHQPSATHLGACSDEERFDRPRTTASPRP